MLERLKISSRKIPNAEVVDIKMTDYDDLILKESKKIINDIGNRLGRSIDDLEINYLYQYLYSSRFQLSTHQQKIEFSTRVVSVTKFYFKKMEMTKSESINEQSPMFIDLANHISPFVGRLEDIGTDAYQLISDLREIIAASIRNTVHVENVAKRGTHIATIPDAFLIK